MDFIYLDNAATTKPDEEIFVKSAQLYKTTYFNPSALYRGAMEAKKIIDASRKKIENIFFGKSVMFTSCGTESDNTAIFSFSKRGNIVTTEGEHSAVYKCFEQLKQKGVEVRYAKLRYGGAVDEEDLLSKIDEKTSFVSVVHVNNETGAINDVNNLAKKVKEINPLTVFHSDGVQAFGKIAADIENVHLYSVSAHKIGALKGTGCLLYNKNLHVQPLIFGGGQEGGLRSGTENVLGITMFAECAEKRYNAILENYEKVTQLKAAFSDKLDGGLFKIISDENASPYIISFSAVGLRGQVVQSILDDNGIIIGTGSACSSKAPHSRILSSFEKSKKVLDGALRVGLDYTTTFEQIEKCAEILNKKVSELSKKINR